MLRKYYDRPDFLKMMMNDNKEEVIEKGSSLLILPDKEGKKKTFQTQLNSQKQNPVSQ